MTVGRFRILDRYLVREVLPPTGLGLLVFTFVILLQRLTYLAGVLISRSADVPTTLSLLGHALPAILGLTIPMAFLLGVLLAFGRLASESEIVALRASGVSPLQMLRPVLLLAGVAAALTVYMTAVAQPRSSAAAREALYSLVLGKARAGVRPKVFTEDLVPGMTFYVSDVDAETGEWCDLFISDAITDPGRVRLTLARRGQLALDEGRKLALLRLRDAASYVRDAQDPSKGFEETFAAGKIPLPFDQVFPKAAPDRSEAEMSVAELVRVAREREAAGQSAAATLARMFLHRRLAIPVACFVFGILGLSLSLGQRKEARSAAFGLSLAVICVYYVLLRAGEQAAANGLVPPAVGAWAANVALGAVAVGLFVLRHRESAFDPLSGAQYVGWLPSFPLARAPRVDPGLTRRVRRRRGPGLLDTYVARYFAGFGLLVLLAFWAAFVLFDFIDLFDDVQQNRVPGRVVVHYYGFLSPMVLQLMAPFAALVATLAALGVLARRNEIVAMLAGGISLYRVVLPLVVSAMLGGLGLFGLGEYVVPHTNRKAASQRQRIKGQPPQSTSGRHDRWMIGSEGRIYYYLYFSPGTVAKARAAGAAVVQPSLHAVSIYDVDVKTWRLREQVHATAARWNGMNYELERGWRRTFGEHGRFREFDEIRTRDLDPPDYFRRELLEADSLPFLELRDHVAFMDRRGAEVAPLRVQLHKKLALPLTMVVMVLLGIRFAFTVGRRGALYGIGVSVVIAIAFLVTAHLFEAMGNHALLPPFLAAWAPNILFGTVGLYLMSTLET